MKKEEEIRWITKYWKTYKPYFKKEESEIDFDSTNVTLDFKGEFQDRELLRSIREKNKLNA